MGTADLGMETEVVCRMAFEPESLARTVDALAQEGVMVLGYTFEPHRDRGRARFWTTDPQTAVLTLERLGLEPRIAPADETEGPDPPRASTAQALGTLARRRARDPEG